MHVDSQPVVILRAEGFSEPSLFAAETQSVTKNHLGQFEIQRIGGSGRTEGIRCQVQYPTRSVRCRNPRPEGKEGEKSEISDAVIRNAHGQSVLSMCPATVVLDLLVLLVGGLRSQ